MLGKLVKHDFKATGKVLLPLNLLLVIFTIIGTFLLNTKLLQRPELFPLAIILLVTYILFVLSLALITVLYLTVYFYRNLFSAQGYLTFTLPTTPWTLLHSKVIMGFAWLMLNGILSLVSAWILCVSASGLSLSELFFSFDTTYTVNGVSMEYSSNLLNLLGYSVGELIVLFTLYFITCSVFSVLLSYASVALGQLYSKHKVGGTIGIYIGLTFLFQIIISAILTIICIRPVISFIAVTEEDLSPAIIETFTQALYKPMLPAFIIIYLVFGIGFYFITGMIMNKKVNLD